MPAIVQTATARLRRSSRRCGRAHRLRRQPVGAERLQVRSRTPLGSTRSRTSCAAPIAATPASSAFATSSAVPNSMARRRGLPSALPSRTSRAYRGRIRRRQGADGARDPGQLRAARQAFVTVNCGALPRRWSSRSCSATRRAPSPARPKSTRQVRGGQRRHLFLDEIGELSLDAQVKLLRALQEGEIDPVGARDRSRSTCASSRPPTRTSIELVKAARFREDLFYRLNVFPISIPPLRARACDVPTSRAASSPASAPRRASAFAACAPRRWRCSRPTTGRQRPPARERRFSRRGSPTEMN